jgi:hypothetical protein
MKNYNRPNNSFFRNAIKYDTPDIQPDRAIEQRLNYYYSLKQPMRKVHANSFVGMFLWLLSWKSIGLKAGFVSVCLVYMLFIGNMRNNTDTNKLSDTCQIHQLLVDTNYIVKDTCK